MYEKPTIIGSSVLVNERHFRHKNTVNDLYTMLHCVRSVFLDIWRVERCVCFWLSCLSKATSSSTVVTFSSLPACFSLPLSCLCSVLPVFYIFVINMFSLFLLQFIFKKFFSIFCKVYFLKLVHSIEIISL